MGIRKEKRARGRKSGETNPTWDPIQPKQKYPNLISPQHCPLTAAADDDGHNNGDDDSHLRTECLGLLTPGSLNLTPLGALRHPVQ